MTKIFAYHASPNKFDQFSKEFIGGNTDTESTKLGFFFTKHKQVAMSYFSKGMNQELTLKEEEAKLQSKINDTESRKKIILDEYKKSKSKESIEELKAIGIELNKLKSEKEEMDSMTDEYILNDVGSKDLEKLDDAYLYECYLNMENPYIFDYGSDHYDDKKYTKIIKDGISKGHDSVIIKNTYNGGSSTGLIETDIYVVFEPEQIEIVNSIHSSELDNKEVYECKHIKRFGDFIKESVAYHTQNDGDEYQITKVTVDDYHQYERCDGILYELSRDGGDFIAYVEDIEHTEENQFYDDQVERYVKYIEEGGALESFPVQETQIGDAYNLEEMLEYLGDTDNFDLMYELVHVKGGNSNGHTSLYDCVDSLSYDSDSYGIEESVLAKIRNKKDLDEHYGKNYLEQFDEEDIEDYGYYWEQEYYDGFLRILEYWSDNKRYTLEDMNHRFTAIKQLGIKRVYVDLS